MFFRLLPGFTPKTLLPSSYSSLAALTDRKARGSHAEAVPVAAIVPIVFGNFKPPLFHQFHAAAHTLG